MRFTPGIYQHYKGKQYLALGLAIYYDSAGARQTFVVYICLYNNNGKEAEQCVRPLTEWNEIVYQSHGPLHGTRRYTLITPLGP